MLIGTLETTADFFFLNKRQLLNWFSIWNNRPIPIFVHRHGIVKILKQKGHIAYIIHTVTVY